MFTTLSFYYPSTSCTSQSRQAQLLPRLNVGSLYGQLPWPPALGDYSQHPGQAAFLPLEWKPVEYCYFSHPFPPSLLNFSEQGKLIPTKSAVLGGQGRSCKTEVHSILIFSRATLTY